MNCRRKYQVGNIFLSPRHHQRQRGSAAAAPHTHLLLTTSLSPLNSPTQDWIKTKQAEFWKDLDDYDYVAPRCLFNKIESCCSCSHCVHKKRHSHVQDSRGWLPAPSSLGTYSCCSKHKKQKISKFWWKVLEQFWLTGDKLSQFISLDKMEMCHTCLTLGYIWEHKSHS